MTHKYLDQAGTQLLIDTLKLKAPTVTRVECDAAVKVEVHGESAPALICDTPNKEIPDGGMVAVNFHRQISTPDGLGLFDDARFSVETKEGFSCTQKPVLLRIGQQEYPVWYHGRIGGSQNDVVVGGPGVKYYTLQPMNVQYPYEGLSHKTWDHVWMWVSQEKDKDTKYNFSEFIVNFRMPADEFISENNELYKEELRPFYFNPDKIWLKADKSWIRIIEAWAAGRTVVAVVEGYNIRLPLSQILFDDGVIENEYVGRGTIAFRDTIEGESWTISREYNNIGDGDEIPGWGSMQQLKNADPFPMWELSTTRLATYDDVQNIPLTTVQGWFE